jgi:hypothetical protein
MKKALERPGLEPHSLETDDWRSSFDTSPFEPLREEKVEQEVLTLDAERLVTLYLSTSSLGTLPPEEFEAMEKNLRELIVGEYRLPIRTELYWTRLSK